jgi:glycosyltransferase involved in cell wall biosynthesis
MKILIISDAWEPQLNGVVRTYQNLIAELEQNGHEVEILGPRDFLLRTPMIHGAQTAFFSRKKIEETITQFKPDRIHIAVEGPMGWAARSVCLEKNLPFTSCFHSNWADFLVSHLSGPLKKSSSYVSDKTYDVLRKFHEASSGIFVASQQLADHLKEKGFKGPFLPMTRGADKRYFYVGEQNLFDNLPHPIALSVGRISKEKNLDAFLDASWDGSKIVVGDGPDLERLKKKYPDGHFLGRIEGQDLGDCFRSSDVFAFPSLFDTLGIVQIEAMTCGLPIAAFNCVAANSVITSPILGAIDDNFGKALNQALNAEGTRQDRAQIANDEYSWGKTAQQFLEARPDYG